MLYMALLMNLWELLLDQDLLNQEYMFAGKTGTSQIRTITAEERELKPKTKRFAL